ncbi:MAG: DUF177 domain-containing protein [Pyrinomonadaceae bacterium]|nr:DUF177 domain-containing protein [Pyrinomonadaceae bacterium]
MRVELPRLDNKAVKFSHEYAAGELVLDDDSVVLAAVPRVFGRISRTEHKVLVEGEFAAVAEVECDRCLQPVELPISSDFRLEYVTAETYKSLATFELAQEDLALSVFDGEFIDVDDIVREQLLLAIPTHAICQENCKGFCPVCSADRNVTDCKCNATETDPRWMGLKELVNRKS